MTVGENIRKIRKEKGLTQKQLGELLNMTQSAIGQFENDKTSPKIETIKKIASALDVSITDILGTFKNSYEYKKLEKLIHAQEGIISILIDIYERVESKEISGKYGAGHYYLIGKDEEQFILYDGDINTLYELAKVSIPVLIERIKDTRSEKIVTEEYLKILNDSHISSVGTELMRDYDNIPNTPEELEKAYPPVEPKDNAS